MNRIDAAQANLPKAAHTGGRFAIVRAVAARELRDHLLGARFRLIVGTALVLTLLSTLAGTFNYRAQLEQYQTSLERARQKLHEATTWSELQAVLVRPVAPLMILNSGFETRDGRIAVASNGQIPASTEDSPVGTPYLARFSELDVTTVMVYLLGLLAVLLSFDAVSGERERGTLALSFSNSLARWQVVLGKYLGGMCALALALTASLLTALSVWLVSGTRFPGAEWPRVFLWLLAILIYLSAMFWIGLLISVLTRRTSSSLLAAMVTWFALVIFVPALAAFEARQLIRSPSSYALEKEMAKLSDELEQRSAEFKKSLGEPPESEGFSISLEQGVSMNFYSPETYAWWIKYYAARAQLEREYALKTYNAIKESLARNRAQAEMAFKLSALSPVAHLERVVDELTATSRDDAYNFLEAARRYRERLVAFYDANHLTTSLRWITDDPPGAESPFPKGAKLGERAKTEEETKRETELGKQMYARVMAERESG
ncbi:MAG: ABC transporter permease subunit, partial [Acidobacteriota bacterium]|nr:ABC transporter permease subunit [Acidobacteriota bacterium]